ncbi:hypothetical protein [Nocardia macrotermitis]|uniref:Uncharacterized protein n=1 Tax=Nocardia macrotermitis TaxID=2585198 RepID=A0A7K0DB59_9NOCA|nr:hypothetical protein [Nocardia macrotermitis]MQY22908.1 hypothetical protein [Nocardia macrotermitis]
MDMTLTESVAREHINTYLLDTLRKLPSGVQLSATPDNPNLATLGPEIVINVPCDDNNDDPRNPVQTTIAYWIAGLPGGQTDHYFQEIRDYWTGRGFRLNPDSSSSWAGVRTPDGYSLVIKNAGKGDGSLSITSGSPCFPKSGEGTTTPQPTELRRPS